MVKREPISLYAYAFIIIMSMAFVSMPCFIILLATGSVPVFAVVLIITSGMMAQSMVRRVETPERINR